MRLNLKMKKEMIKAGNAHVKLDSAKGRYLFVPNNGKAVLVEKKVYDTLLALEDKLTAPKQASEAGTISPVWKEKRGKRGKYNKAPKAKTVINPSASSLAPDLPEYSYTRAQLPVSTAFLNIEIELLNLSEADRKIVWETLKAIHDKR